MSARVRHAEDLLGVKLFHRTTRKVTVSAHGARLVARAEQAMAELRALAQEFRDEARLVRGRVVVGATPAIGGSLLPGILQTFRKRWPGVELVLHDDFLSRALERVHIGDVDFAVTPSAPWDERFISEPLMMEEFLLLGREDHPLLESSPVDLRRIADYDVVSMPNGTATRELLERAMRSQGQDFRPAFETHNLLSVVAMVKAGFGVTFMPTELRSLFDMTGLRTASLAPHPLFREIAIIRAKGRAVQPATEALIDALKEGFQAASRRQGRAP